MKAPPSRERERERDGEAAESKQTLNVDVVRLVEDHDGVLPLDCVRRVLRHARVEQVVVRQEDHVGVLGEGAVSGGFCFSELG
jgi:hypothetical protein